MMKGLARHGFLKSRVMRGLTCACLLVGSGQPAAAHEFLEDLKLIGLGFGGLSSVAASFRNGTGGLSDGSRYSFRRYYTSEIRDVRITMLSPINPNLGIIWGLGTGESGAKYRIDPSLKLGFLATEPLGDNEWLSLTVTTVLGGRFRESSCTADYGAIGGIQEVNCRLADSLLPPADTLQYLVDQAPPDQLNISLRYWLYF